MSWVFWGRKKEPRRAGSVGLKKYGMARSAEQQNHTLKQKIVKDMFSAVQHWTPRSLKGESAEICLSRKSQKVILAKPKGPAIKIAAGKEEMRKRIDA